VRIAVNTRFLLPTGLEGLGVYTQEIAHRLTVLLPQHEWHFLYDRTVDQKFLISNAQHHVIYPPARHPILWYTWFELCIPKKLRQLKADLFFSPDGYASLSTPIPQLLTIHDVAFEFYPKAIPFLVNRYYRYYTPKFCQAAKRIIVVSEKTANDLQTLYQVPKEKIQVVANGYSALFHPLDAADRKLVRMKYAQGQPFYIYVGAIHPRKNVLNILKAFELLIEQQPYLPHRMLLVGRKAWNNADIEAYLLQMSAKDRVIWLDHVDRQEIAALMGAAEAMVYPSYYEGFGLPVLEAMACGTPSITSLGSPMEWFAADTCLTVRPQNPEEISQAMHALATQTGLSAALSKKAIERSQQYTWDQAAEKIANEIENHFANKNFL
jgi:glycosyltransferase involved in cell wall biosynthesis